MKTRATNQGRHQLVGLLIIGALSSSPLLAAEVDLLTNAQTNIVNNNTFIEGDTQGANSANPFITVDSVSMFPSSTDSRSATQHSEASAQLLRLRSVASGALGDEIQASAQGGASSTVQWLANSTVFDLTEFDATFTFTWSGTLKVENSAGEIDWNRASATLNFDFRDSLMAELPLASYSGTVSLLAGASAPVLDNLDIFDGDGVDIGTVEFLSTQITPNVAYGVQITGSLPVRVVDNGSTFVTFDLQTNAAAEDTLLSSEADFFNGASYSFVSEVAGTSVGAVPEPAPLACLAAAAMAGLLITIRRRKIQSQPRLP